MKRSGDRILTTHTGSLPRPPDLVPMLHARDRGEPYDESALISRVHDGVRDIVRKQRDTGIDVVSDGEVGKVSYATYITERLTGFGGQGKMWPGADNLAFPEYNARRTVSPTMSFRKACVGPIAYRDEADLNRELADLRSAVDEIAVEDAFLTAASPGVVTLFLENQYYPSHDAYLAAVADAMKTEYDAIHRAGFVLQIDCPDLAMGRHSQYTSLSLEEFRRIVALHVDVVNAATRDIPPEAMRMHLCWGNYEGPHHLDVPLSDIIDIVLKARPAGLSFEGANPRHEHEWALWADLNLPEGKILIPGVIDSTTNFIEHPDLVAERIVRYARIVGRENIIAGVDCGFGTGAGAATVDPDIAWAKLGSLADGARRATAILAR